MQCYTKSAPFFLFFVKAEESYYVTAVITFDTVDEGSNNRPRGDLALRFRQSSGVRMLESTLKPQRPGLAASDPLASTFPPIVQLSTQRRMTGWEAPCPPWGRPMERLLHSEHAGDVMF